MSNFVTAIAADPFGRILDELEPEIGSVSWVLNGVGGATIRMATNDPKWVPENFRFGGILLLEFGNGLPPFAGVVTSRKWVEGGTKAEVSYLSAEHILTKRETSKAMTFLTTPAGHIARSVLQYTNGLRTTGIGEGDFWAGGDPLTREYHVEKLFDVLENLRADTRGDWGITTRGVSSDPAKKRVDLTLYFWSRRGADRPDVALIQDHNMTVVDYTEQEAGGEAGGLITEWTVYGGGQAWDDSRLEGLARADDAVAEYNLRQESEILNDVFEQGTLDARSAARLAKSLRPFRALTVEAANLAPAPFASYDVGDRVKVLAHRVGFGGLDEMAKVIGRSHNPNKQTCQVVLELDT